MKKDKMRPLQTPLVVSRYSVVACGREAFLDANAALGKVAVEWPAYGYDDETRKSG